MSKATKQPIKNIDAMLSDDSEEVPVKKTTTAKATKAPVKAVAKKDSDDESSESEIEILKTKAKRPAEAKKEEKTVSALPKAQAKVVKKPVVVASDSDEESSEEVKPKKAVVPAKKAPVKKQESSEESSEEEVKPKKAVVPAKKAPVKKEESSEEESSEEEVKKPVAKVVAKAPAKKEESSEEESDEEEVVKTQPKVVAKPEVAASGCTELFCKNLSWNTDENLLGEFFGKFGTVNNVKVLYDKMTGKARGLAFVEFATREEAQAAIDDAANLEIDGRVVQVTFSDQKPERPQGNTFQNNRQEGGYQNRGNSGSGRSNFDGERFTAFVGNLGFKTNEVSVKKFFAECGNVVDVRIAKNEEGRSKGFCHVDFDSNDAVEKAKTKAGESLDGREIRVDSSTPRQGGGQRGGFDRGGRGRGFGGDRGGRGRGFGGRGGSFNPMDRAKRSGAMIPNSGAVRTFDDDE